MAIVYGRSASWDHLSKRIEDVGIKAAHPGQIAPILNQLLSEYSQKYRQIHRQFELEIWKNELQLQADKELAAIEIQQIKEKSELELSQSEANLDVFQNEQGMAVGLRGHFQKQRETTRFNEIKIGMQKALDAIESPLKTREASIKLKKANIDELSHKECSQELAQIDLLKEINASQELQNVFAEFDLLDYLTQLSDSFVLFKNVKIRLNKPILIEGKRIDSADIDHLVLSESGLFAIKMITGTKQTYDQKSGNPFEQIRISARLCLEILRPMFPAINVRGILAYQTFLPNHPDAGTVKALEFPDVPAYVYWFKDTVLSIQEINRLISLIQGFQQP